jgi:hypothetical protein
MTSGSRDALRKVPSVHAVLGMHRSGTSALAGSFQQKGLALGTVNESAQFNKKGNRESFLLQHIHDNVLKASGGSWQDPPATAMWPGRERDRLRAFIADMNTQHERWGFKDPRTLLLLDEWQLQIPMGIAFVGVYRHPISVARSLTERNAMPQVEGVDLWCRYNERLVSEHQRAPFPILRFDDKPGELLGGIDAVARSWMLPAVATAGTFFDPELRHHDSQTMGDVPQACRGIWSYLESHRLTC